MRYYDVSRDEFKDCTRAEGSITAGPLFGWRANVAWLPVRETLINGFALHGTRTSRIELTGRVTWPDKYSGECYAVWARLQCGARAFSAAIYKL